MRTSITLDTPDKAGHTPRQRYEDRDEDYEEPEPFFGGYLLRWYWQIRAQIGADMNGKQPMPWAAIVAWSQLIGVHLSPWEIQMLIALDAEFISGGREATMPDMEKTVALAKETVRSSAIQGRRVVKRQPKMVPSAST